MKCFKCEKGMPEHTLYRVNEKGVSGIWACKEHRTTQDPELDELVKVIEKGDSK